MLRLDAHHPAIVLRHGDRAHGDHLNARDVWVYESGGRYFMHYDAAGDEAWLAALATSEDGLSWTKQGPVLALGPAGAPDSASASYGSTYFDGERWHMFYLGTPNATDDGLNTPAFPYLTLKAEADSPAGPWRKRPDVVPFEPQRGSWFSHTASPGHIVERDGELTMVLSGSTVDADGAIFRTLGLARTRDLDGPWAVDPEPLLPLTEQIENSSLHYEPEGGWWFLFTNHIGVAEGLEPVSPQMSTEYTDAVWVYWARELEGFRPEDKAVVLDARNVGWSPRIVGLPSVLRIGDRLAVYYDGCQEDTIGHGGRDVGVAWLDLPLRPPA